MTPDKNTLVGRLEARLAMLGPTPDVMLRFMDGIKPLIKEAAAEIERLTRELYLEKNRADNLIDNYNEANTRALAAESSLHRVRGEQKITPLTKPVLPGADGFETKSGGTE